MTEKLPPSPVTRLFRSDDASAGRLVSKSRSAALLETAKLCMRRSELKSRITKMNYQEYIRSPEWKATKIRYLKSKMPKDCGVCGAPWSNAMQFHHKTYKRLGNERLMDIVPVCDGCHEAIHEIHKGHKLNGLWWCLREARKRRMRCGTQPARSRKPSAKCSDASRDQIATTNLN